MYFVQGQQALAGLLVPVQPGQGPMPVQGLLQR
jgi:hypothetical protein